MKESKGLNVANVYQAQAGLFCSVENWLRNEESSCLSLNILNGKVEDLEEMGMFEGIHAHLIEDMVGIYLREWMDFGNGSQAVAEAYKFNKDNKERTKFLCTHLQLACRLIDKVGDELLCERLNIK